MTNHKVALITGASRGIGAAKAATAQFARYVAQEFGPAGITANTIAPGFVTCKYNL
jgi:NAD(P)-dependent dehydrogenase (short-subunit alcohol dehydrogenase family)